MADQSAQASELIDDIGLEISEDMVHPVKGTGRPDLDENEEDDSTDVAEQANMLSDFEDEDYVSEVVVESLPLVIPEGEETSPRREASKLDNRVVEVLVSTEEETSFGEAALNVDHNVHGDAASPIVSGTVTVDRNIPPWQAFSETNFLSESDEDDLFGPNPVATVHFERSSNKFMEGPFGERPINSVHSVSEDSLLPLFSSTLTVGQNSQPLKTFSKTKKFSESGEEEFLDPRSDVKVHFNQTSGMAVDTLGASVSKAEVGEEMPLALPSPKLDHVGDVMLRLGSKPGLDSGADGLEADSKSTLKLDVRESTRRKGTIMRLGSKEAEQLLQLDLSKMGRAILPSVKKGFAGAKSPKPNGVGWGVEDLGPDEVIWSYLSVEG